MPKKAKGPDAPKVGPRTRLRLINPLNPRLLMVLRFLEERGGTVQMSLEKMSEATGTYSAGLSRWIGWLEVYGAIHIDRATGSMVGVGSNPHRYHQLMSVADYERDAVEIRDAIRAKLRPPKKPKRQPLPRLPLIEPDEMELIRQQARAEVEASIRAFRPLPELREDPLDHIEAEAWRLAFNAD